MCSEGSGKTPLLLLPFPVKHWKLFVGRIPAAVQRSRRCALEAALSPGERETSSSASPGPGSEQGAGLSSGFLMVPGGMRVFQPFSWCLKECH